MNLFKKSVLLAVFLPWISGCIALAVGGGALGVSYTLGNVAYKTVNYPLKKVDRAVVQASKRMDITIVSNFETESGREIKGATRDLDIEVELEAVTPKTTKISINAKKGMIEKDKATATELIKQTERILAG